MAKKARQQDRTQRATEIPAQTPGTASTTPAAVVAPPPPASSPQHSSLFQILRSRSALRALQLAVLAAIYSSISQLTLAPVYGSVPAAHYHRYGLTVSALLAFSLRGYVPSFVTKAIPSFCFWIPTLQFLLFKASSSLGNPLGPVVTEFVTFYPLAVLSLHTGFESLDELFKSFDSPIAETAPAMGLFLFFTFIQRGAKDWVPKYIGSNVLFSRVGLQLSIATLYAFAVPNALLWPALPSVAFNMIANPHTALNRTTEVLNNTLALYDYTLLERKESITGYISVLEDNNKKFRVMRCDHSLLGGEWILPPPKDRVRKVAEPIYAIFTMLEAVRLVEPSTPNDSAGKTALNIGLGIGTAPAALIHHGINTTILELDPAVHTFAIKYFNLPPAHQFYIGDAVTAVAQSTSATALAKLTPADQYDYIVHDVFTGGAEPAQLFTFEFLSGLRALLKPQGAIAINYAGDLNMPAASLVYRTVIAVFGGSCRVFREDERASGPGDGAADFTNMVFFCRRHQNPATAQPITFRKPVDADFLGSAARKEFLLPKHEILPHEFEREGDLLRRGNVRLLETWQAKSAIGHWKVMRTVLPDGVWENW